MVKIITKMIEGIIYNIIDYKEKSSLVYLYTEYGKDSILVRGAKDYKSGNISFCEYLNYVAYDKSNNNLPYLVNYEVKDRFQNIKNSLIKLKYASIILEVLRQIEDTRYARIFKFSLNMLTNINNGFDPISICYIYLAKMLKLFGILPNLEDNPKLKEAYYSKEYKEEYTLKDLTNLINYYEYHEVINTTYLRKILGDNL